MVVEKEAMKTGLVLLFSLAAAFVVAADIHYKKSVGQSILIVIGMAMLLLAQFSVRMEFTQASR